MPPRSVAMILGAFAMITPSYASYFEKLYDTEGDLQRESVYWSTKPGCPSPNYRAIESDKSSPPSISFLCVDKDSIERTSQGARARFAHAIWTPLVTSYLYSFVEVSCEAPSKIASAYYKFILSSNSLATLQSYLAESRGKMSSYVNLYYRNGWLSSTLYQPRGTILPVFSQTSPNQLRVGRGKEPLAEVKYLCALNRAY